MSCAVCHMVCGPLKGETHSWRCAGVLAGQRKTLHRLHAITEDTAAEYDSPGKRKARDLVIAVAANDCRTFLDLWGGGQSARAAVAAGLEVTSAEKVRSLFAAMKLDAKEHGYSVWPKSIGRIKGMFDFVFADFCSGASPPTRLELRKIVPHVGKWLAVTLAPDHQLDQSLQGPVASFTVPAWIIGATGMQLRYLGRYVRNGNGQTMWIALLERGERLKHAGNHLMDPVAIARGIQHRGYWNSKRFGTQFPELGLAKDHFATDRRRAAVKAYNQRPEMVAYKKEWLRQRRDHHNAIRREWRRTSPTARQNEASYAKAYNQRPEVKERARQRSIAYYAAHKDEVNAKRRKAG